METGRDIRKTILTQMKVPEETKHFLEQITSPIIQEWSYLCAAIGMDLNRIRRISGLAENDISNTAAVFMQEREVFLRERYENNRVLGDQVINLQAKVESMYQRAASVEGALDDTIRKTLHDKDELFGKVIESKNDLIREKDMQIKSLHEQIEGYQKLEERITPTKDEPYVSAAVKEDGIHSDKKKGSSDSNQYLEWRYYPPVIKESFFARLRSEWMIRRFIKNYIDNEDYSSSQKDYLMQCLEEGDNLSMIKKFASHALSIDQMKELRRIGRERR